MENRRTLWSKPHRSQEKKPKHFSHSFLDTSNTEEDPSSPNIQRKLAKAYLKSQTEFEEQLKHNSRNHASSLNQILHRRGKSFENSHMMSKQQKSKLGESKIDEEEKLKKKVKTLQKTVNKQNEALENVIQKVLKGRDEMKSITKHLIKDKNKENAIHVLRDKVNDMQHQESHLQDELENQKKITEDLLLKMHAVKTESVAEVENAKVHYKEFYTRNLEKEIEQYRVKTLQFSRDKEELLNSLREVEKARDLEKLATLNTDREISKVKHDVDVHKRENTTLKDELKNLKAYMKEKDERHAQEVEILKNCVEQLRKENTSLKETMDERGKKELHDKNQLKKTIRDLEEEVSRKEKTGFRTEINHHDELDHARRQIRKLEEENRLLLEDQRKMDDLKRELKMSQEEFQIKERHYKEKIEMSKRAQEKRKIEWSGVYNELLQEVKELKQGMGFLENENNKLLSSIDSRSFDQNYSYNQHH